MTPQEEVQLDSRGKPRVQTSFEGIESLTVQSDAHRADIRNILRQYKQVGIVDNLNRAEAVFKDVSEFTDFSDAMRMASMAEQDFMKLPSKVREIFNHDVAEWLDTAHDPEKRDALVAAGIIEASVAPIEEVGPAVVPPDAEAAGQAD